MAASTAVTPVVVGRGSGVVVGVALMEVVTVVGVGLVPVLVSEPHAASNSPEVAIVSRAMASRAEHLLFIGSSLLVVRPLGECSGPHLGDG
jgi:hypothetical protein